MALIVLARARGDLLNDNLHLQLLATVPDRTARREVMVLSPWPEFAGTGANL